MTDRYGSPPPDDEPIIGATYPPTSQPPSRGAYIGAPEPPPYYEDEYDDDGYEDEYEYDDDGYYDDEYYEGTPARQPLFYLFIGLAALVGGVIVFLLFSMVNNGGGNDGGTPSAAQFKVRIDSPVDGSRIEIGKTEDVLVSATSNKPINRFELFVNDASVDSQNVTATPTDNTYSATLRMPPFNAKGNFKVYVRVTTSSNEHADSAKITVVAIQPVGDKPLVVKGKVIATVNVRKGPGENYDLVKTLDNGQDVNIIGKTRDGEWLLVDIEGGTWVKRAAIQEQDSLALVPVKDPTPIPEPTATNTVQPLPSPTASPTTNPKLPDLLASNAQLTDGGAKLRVAIGNASTNSYSGPVIVAVGGIAANDLESAFQVDIPANGSATVTFDLNPAVTTQKTVTIKIDPKNLIKESNKDNNAIQVGLVPAAEPPQLSLQAQAQPNGTLTVVIANSGGPLAAPAATIRVKLGNQSTAIDTSLAIDKGKSQTIANVSKPQGSGNATIEVIVNNAVIATAEIPIQ